MKIYKYLSKEHMLSFKNQGLIRINTLSNLRLEHEAIRDKTEGHGRIRVGSDKKQITFTGKEFHEIFPSMKSDKPNVLVTIGAGSSITSPADFSSLFVFCASRVLDIKLAKKFGYDAYYMIKDAEMFAETVYWKLNERILIGGFKADLVRYSNKKTKTTTKPTVDDFVDLCFIKPTAYKTECEYRIVFLPMIVNKKIVPIDLVCPELLKYCKFPSQSDLSRFR